MSQKQKDALSSLRALSQEDLKNKLENSKEDLFWLRYKNRSSQNVAAGDLRNAKREVAHIQTILKEKAE